MQKKIIALAVAAVASGAAFAQTNVTISGNMNYQIQNISASNPSNPAATIGQKVNLEGRNKVNENGSELKFAITEDLGNGLKAGVVIASGIQPTDGNAASTGSPSLNGTGISGPSASRGGLGGRDTYISLAGKFGTIRTGRQSMHFNAQGKVDDFGANTALAANSLAILNASGFVGSGNASGSTIGTGSAWAGYGHAAGGRFANATSYTTPAFGGFVAELAYARPNSTAANSDGLFNTTASTIRKESAWTVKLNYDNGPMNAFLSYIAHNDISWRNTGLVGYTGTNTLVTPALFKATTCSAATATAGGGACAAGTTGPTTWSGEVRGFRLGGSYAFGNGLKIGLIYDTNKTLGKDDTSPATNSDFNTKRTAWVIPVSWTFGPHKVGGTYGKAGNTTGGGSLFTGQLATADMNQTGARYWMAGYQYAFSKRTNIGVTFARIDNDSRAGYDFFQNAYVGVTANTRGADPTTVSLGMKHSF